MSRPANIVVMGVGNLLCTDDGVGVHAVRELTAHCHPERSEAELRDLVSLEHAGRDLGSDSPVTFVDAGTAILHALSFVEEATHLLVIDAVRAGGAPGTVYTFDGYEMANAADVQSLHSLGLRQALEFVEPEQRPDTFMVLGVEPAVVAYGMELSSPVRAVLPDVVEQAGRVVSEWARRTVLQDGSNPRLNRPGERFHENEKQL